MASWKRLLCKVVLGSVATVLIFQVAIHFMLPEIQTSEVVYYKDGNWREYKTGEIVHERLKYTENQSTWSRMDTTNIIIPPEEGFDEGQFYHNFVTDRLVTGIKNRTDYAIENDLPILLWWTHFTNARGEIKRCKEGECYFTELRKFQNHSQTKVFFFYGTDFNDTDLPLPRKAHQEWALLHEESPKNSFLYAYEDIMVLFNHTATFKQESDYPITTQYLDSLAKLVTPPKYTFKQKDTFGLAPVAYVQSGCNPPSDRDAYVNELMKFIQIDSYGKCLHNKDPEPGLDDPLKMHDQVQVDFLSKYKFVLTFENAICKDYITEKLWNPMYGGAVPVYRGAPNIEEWMPNNHSIIVADHFESPKHLAEFLNRVARNQTEYEKYLEYKTHGITNSKLRATLRAREWGINDFEAMNFITGFECFVCDRVHANRKRIKNNETENIHIAKLNHYGCPAPSLYPFDSPPGTEEYERSSWEFEYNRAKDIASSVRDKASGKTRSRFHFW